jgi:hypothetical protein
MQSADLEKLLKIDPLNQPARGRADWIPPTGPNPPKGNP